MTSATDELRRMLDERGVEHYDGTESTLWLKDEHGYRASADELTSGRMSVHIWCETPEQAIDATLGPGTCHIKVYFGEWYCTGCGDMVGTCDPDSELCVDGNYVSMWNFCPNCGAKVVDE